MSYNLITILGPTAVGKTRLSVLLAHHYNGEIISADSRQVYRKMNIGTGKDYSDYIVDGEKIKYHLIDITEPSEEFNLYLYKQMFYESFRKISDAGKIPFLVGGTGMYLSSIIQDYELKPADRSIEKLKQLSSLNDDELVKLLRSRKNNLHNITDLTDRKRITEAILIADSELGIMKDEKIVSLNIGIQLPRNIVKKMITERLSTRLKQGMIEEVKTLLDEGIKYEKLISFGLEYKFITMYLMQEISYNDMFQKLNSAIHNFAKRQMTWFRKMEKEGVEIFWVDGSDFNVVKKIIENKFFQNS
jgi:tRNA dimethylallyltransferase